MGDKISPWIPEQDRIQLAVLSKLSEEASELAGRAARCIMQGVDEFDPDTNRTNIDELQREIADVLACIVWAREVYDLEIDEKRVAAKCGGFHKWAALIKAAERG